MGFTKELSRDFVVRDLGPALAKAGYTADKLKVMIYDDHRKWDNESGLVLWANHHFNDAEAAKYLSGIAYHCYENLNSPWSTLDDVHKAQPNKFVLMTECCQEFQILPKGAQMRLGIWNNSEIYAADIMQVYVINKLLSIIIKLTSLIFYVNV